MIFTPALAASSTAVAAASPSSAMMMMALTPCGTMFSIWSFCSFASWLATWEMTWTPWAAASLVM